MCGRYRLSRRKQLVAEYFDAVPGDAEWNPRYNIAPAQPVPIIRQHPKEPRRELSLVRWGLIPSWAKDASVSAQMINARSESAATKPAFRDALASRRCLVPADGFYECVRRSKAKQPYCFEVNDGELFAFAGLWENWKGPSGQWIKSCSILTTTPNAVTSAVHNRMPVILDRDDYDLWLDPGMRNVDAVSELLKPYDARAMRSYPVSNRVNHVTNDDAELFLSKTTEPVEAILRYRPYLPLQSLDLRPAGHPPPCKSRCRFNRDRRASHSVQLGPDDTVWGDFPMEANSPMLATHRFSSRAACSQSPHSKQWRSVQIQ